MMNANFDFTGIIDAMMNAELLKNKEAAPLTILLNKYGIRGIKAMEFLLELVAIFGEKENNNAVDNTNG